MGDRKIVLAKRRRERLNKLPLDGAVIYRGVPHVYRGYRASDLMACLSPNTGDNFWADPMEVHRAR